MAHGELATDYRLPATISSDTDPRGPRPTAARHSCDEQKVAGQRPDQDPEGKILVTGLKGPLEEGWQKKVEAFASQIPFLL